MLMSMPTSHLYAHLCTCPCTCLRKCLRTCLYPCLRTCLDICPYAHAHGRVGLSSLEHAPPHMSSVRMHAHTRPRMSGHMIPLRLSHGTSMPQIAQPSSAITIYTIIVRHGTLMGCRRSRSPARHDRRPRDHDLSSAMPRDHNLSSAMPRDHNLSSAKAALPCVYTYRTYS